jgi:hypothetical protein
LYLIYLIKAIYHVRSITLHQVGARLPTISANNLQSQKPARPGYYGQSIGHDISQRLTLPGVADSWYESTFLGTYKRLFRISGENGSVSLWLTPAFGLFPREV